MRVVSGGQTGVDRAALDAAGVLGIAVSGWCPAGRWAEDGPIDRAYPLVETPSADPAQRTAWNVRDSDGTLIVAIGSLTGGTALTAKLAADLRRPCLVVDLATDPAPEAVRAWLVQYNIKILNVAGPRASNDPRLYGLALAFLKQVLGPR